MAKNTPPRLGRGLAALLGDVAVVPDGERGTSVEAISIERIDANPVSTAVGFQRRRVGEPCRVDSGGRGIAANLGAVPTRRRPSDTRLSRGSGASVPR